MTSSAGSGDALVGHQTSDEVESILLHGARGEGVRDSPGVEGESHGDAICVVDSRSCVLGDVRRTSNSSALKSSSARWYVPARIQVF